MHRQSCNENIPPQQSRPRCRRTPARTLAKTLRTPSSNSMSQARSRRALRNSPRRHHLVQCPSHPNSLTALSLRRQRVDDFCLERSANIGHIEIWVLPSGSSAASSLPPLNEVVSVVHHSPAETWSSTSSRFDTSPIQLADHPGIKVHHSSNFVEPLTLRHQCGFPKETR